MKKILMRAVLATIIVGAALPADIQFSDLTAARKILSESGWECGCFQPCPLSARKAEVEPDPAKEVSTYYSFCATRFGNSTTIKGGFPDGAPCWLTTPSGPIAGRVVGWFVRDKIGAGNIRAAS
jgi:hypothetical protein